jgi:hypothetical protein
LALAFDDYHLIDARPVHDTLAFLLDHQPPNVHLVVAGRAGLLPRVRLRSRAPLAELRAAARSSGTRTIAFARMPCATPSRARIMRARPI